MASDQKHLGSATDPHQSVRILDDLMAQRLDQLEAQTDHYATQVAAEVRALRQLLTISESLRDPDHQSSGSTDNPTQQLT